MAFMNPKYIVLIFSFLLLNGCVSSSKYFEQLEENKLLGAEIRALKYMSEQNEKLKVTVAEQSEKLYLCEDKLSESEQRVRNMVQQNQVQQQDHLKMNERNKALLEKAFEDKKTLTDELIARQVTINEKDKLIKRLEQKLGGAQNNGSQSSENKTALQSITLITLPSDSNIVAASVSPSFDQLSKNLEVLAPGEFLIEQKSGGKMVVTLNESLLFDQNSTILSDKGKSALLNLIQLLTLQNVKEVSVENVMIAGQHEKSDISMRTGRLLAVYYSLLESGINPKQLVLTGQKKEETTKSTETDPTTQTQKIKIEFNPDQVKN